MLRKPQCDYGWDWNIALAPLGVYGRIGLIGGEGEIGAPCIRQRHENGVVFLDVDLDRSRAAEDATLCTVALGGVETTATPRSRQRPATAEPHPRPPRALVARRPRRPAAARPRHHRRRADPHRPRRRCATSSLVSEPDAAGRSFKVRVNGRDITAMGANWIPADAIPSRITRRVVRDLLESAVAANMNMIRVWGGGQYEPDYFYELCDELGLMVWQDFMFSCMIYPSTASSSPTSRRDHPAGRAASPTTPASRSGAATTR